MKWAEPIQLIVGPLKSQMSLISDNLFSYYSDNFMINETFSLIIGKHVYKGILCYTLVL